MSVSHLEKKISRDLSERPLVAFVQHDYIFGSIDGATRSGCSNHLHRYTHITQPAQVVDGVRQQTASQPIPIPRRVGVDDLFSDMFSTGSGQMLPPHASRRELKVLDHLGVASV